MDVQAQFDHYLSGGFEDVNASASEQHFIRLFRHNYRRFLPTDKNARIVDIGCGLGHALQWLKEDGYSNAIGIDTGKELVAYGKKRGLPVSQVTNLSLWLKKNADSFDAILLNDVIEHLPKDDIIDLVALMYGALKKNGVLIIKTNNVSAITGARMRYWDHTHTTSFTEFSLTQVLRWAGCTNIALYPFSFPLNRPQRLLRRLLQMLQHAVWKFMFWLEYTVVPRIVHEYLFAVVRKK